MPEEATFVPTNPKHASQAEWEEKEPKNTKKIVGITVGVVLALLIAAYVGGGFFFGSHFFPNTAYGDTDISFKSQDELVTQINEEVDNYSVKIAGREFEMELTKEQVPVKVDAEGVAKAAIATQQNWLWPTELFNAHDLSGGIDAEFDQDAVNKLISDEVTKFNKNAKPSEPATIVYKEPEPKEESTEGKAEAAEGDEAKKTEEGEEAEAEPEGNGTFEIKEEVYGTTINTDALLKKVDEEISALGTQVEVTEDDVEKPTILSDDTRLPEALVTANGYIQNDIKLTLNEDVDAGTLEAKTIAGWVALNKDVKAVINEKKVTAWAEEQGKKYNTVGTKRTYKRPDGKEVTVEGGSYGWEIDEKELASAVKKNIEAGKAETIDIPCSSTAAKYAGVGKADWGKYVDVDLSQQMVRYYDADGKLLKECKCVSGKNSSPTPTGVFYLRHKESPSTLVSYYPDGSKKYETKVTYWMPFDRNVVGLHDAWWRGSFGGEIYKYSGSHGCVNLATSNAKWFYQNLKVGTPVIVHK